MDWLAFIAAVISALAWPTVVLVVFLALRKPLRDLLPYLARLKYKDLEVDFGRELRKVEAEAREVLKIPPVTPRVPTAPRHRDAAQLLTEANQLSADFPEPAVAVAWSAVETELQGAVQRLAVSPDYPPDNSARKNARLLADAGIMPSQTVSLLDRLRNLRNLAVHGGASGLGPGPVTPDEAREFVALARGVVEELQRLERPK